MFTTPAGAVTPQTRADRGSIIKLTGHRDSGSTSASSSVPILPKLGSNMNHQRPLAPDSSTSASSYGDMELQPNLPTASLLQRKKKPGPKRDSKPAPSEKLERNRQAQRTHRERKEQYTKDLELEVMRLKELYTNASRERDNAFRVRDQSLQDANKLRTENEKLHEENTRLRVVIQSSSASTESGYETMSVTCDATRQNSFSGTAGYAGIAAPADGKQESLIKPPNLWEQYETRGFASDDVLMDTSPIKVEDFSPPYSSPTQASSSHIGTPAMTLATQPTPAPIDYDELGLDFVLTLERPCMTHIQYLHVRAHNYQASTDGATAGAPMEVPDDGENQHISGHTLMATAPSYTHIMNDPSSRYPTQFPTDLKREDLLRLLDLSSQLQITETELPPVKAWIKIMRDERLGLLSVNDLALLKQTLAAKVQCYRFGAIIDDADIDAAFQYVLECKSNPTALLPPQKPAPCAWRLAEAQLLDSS